MAFPMDRQTMVEELTIMEVILASLQEETFPGAEEERREAEEEIDRMKKALRAMAMNAAAYAAFWSQAAGGGPKSSPIKRRVDAPSSAGPSRSRQSSAAMATPTKPSELKDWLSPASLTLRSRKRDFSSTNLQSRDAVSKSRRTTPTPSGDHLNGTSRLDPFSWDDEDEDADADDDDDGVEVIDLTGPDVDANLAPLAEQIKQEKRHTQEHHDRQMAIRLSSQDHASGSATGSNPAQTTAFSKLMAVQQSNARGPSFPEYDSDEDFEELVPNSLPAWAMGPSAIHSRNPHPMPSQSHYFGHLGTPQPSSFDAFGFPRAHGSSTGHLNSTPEAFGSLNYSLPSSAHRSAAHMSFGLSKPLSVLVPGSSLTPGLPRAPMLPSQGSLSGIINKTGAFDYTDGLDEYGDPLPSRLVDYLHNTYHDPRVTEKELDDLLQNIRPDMDIPEANRDGTPDGLKSSLYRHQAVALTWMKQMEDGTNKGGILADDMGLGKTISTLALMLSRQSKSRPKTNLIIGPVALIRQWEEEIFKKTKNTHRLSVFVYHSKKATTDDLLKYDVVLTTYGTIAQELKRLDKFLEENADRNIDFNDRATGTKFPLLHPRKAIFHRIILDEAQCIKNKDTKTAKACQRLKATYRWCLTGTPMMNGVLELYSLLNFLRIKPYCVWEQFRRSFGTLFGRNGDATSAAMDRLRALLKAIMLRRKKDSELDGKPILKLPEKTEEVVYAELTGDERDFYNQLEKQSQVQFNKYLRDGSVGKNYSSILVLLLRLRQACCHPHLNLDVDDAAPALNENVIELVKALDASIVTRIKEIEAFECPICYDAVQSPLFFIPCGHDSCQQCLTQLVDSAAAMNLQDGTESDKARCPVCRGLFDPKKCFSYEAFQQVHMPESIKKLKCDEEDGSEDDSSGDDSSGSEDELGDDVDEKGNLKGFIVDDGFASGDGPEKKKKRKKKGKKKKAVVKPSMLKALRQAAANNREAYKTYMGYLRKTWLPAAKVSECMRLLKEIYATGEKTIVFSQWTLLLDLLEVAMWHEKYEGLLRRYDGSMSSDQRFDAAQDFREKKDVRVMLVSLRAGNAGLNLTAASRVIIMDPFWNPYTEMQAVDRAYRIGQLREVKVYRILTKETVEDRIVELQNRKKEMVEAALDEAESVKIGRLNVNELKFLFNTNH